MLNEFSRPGYGSDNLIGKLYMTPSAAFPIRTENGLWGGNATWDGYNNPVALAQGRGYSKGHTLGLWADMSLRQDLSSITKGLGASFVWDMIMLLLIGRIIAKIMRMEVLL